MKNHIPTRPGGSDNPEPAETPQHERRFDERGIALQTIIIMVVLLAIAGAVAAVIVSRAGTETDRLESQTDSAVYGITNKTACEIGGHDWQANTVAPGTHAAALNAARADQNWAAATAGPVAWCKPAGS